MSVIFCLLLALTSQSMAVARGTSAATGSMVICTGTGRVAIYMDASGNPTSAPHICPDSALNIIVIGAAPVLVLMQRMVRVQPDPSIIERPVPATPRLLQLSRAPPAFV